MRVRLTSTAIVTAIIAASVMLGVSAPGGAATPAPNYLFNVACPGTGSCMAVGDKFTGATLSTTQTFAEHWNGNKWTITPTPNVTSGANSASELHGVACASLNNCFAVGVGRPASGNEQTLIEHWNGTSWSVVASPNPAPAGHYNELLSVSCLSAANCFAVGEAGTGNPMKTLIEHWNGTSWSIVPSPNPAGATVSMLRGVSCVTNRCFAVGATTNPSAATIIERWNGSVWALIPSPTVSGVPTLNAVACKTTTRCFAVGESEGGASTRSLIELFNGTSWSVLASPNPTGADETALNGVTCSTSTTCFTTGLVSTDFGATIHTLVAQWNGTKWNRVPSPNVSPSDTALGGVACAGSPKPCFAVGSSSTDTSTTSVIERWNATAWAIEPHPQP
jgi:hypothetical protein